MNLIIRVTGKCNFDCTFCSAGNLNIAHPINGVPKQIKEVIKTINPTSITISGGEPLLVGPEYYLELFDIARCNISITTNLKDFYYHPDKWKEVFTHPHIGIVTSFNYGNTRRWNKDTVYTEDKFIEIQNMYNTLIGKQLPFIAVIDNDNYDRCIDHVLLAKKFNTEVRLNNATTQGKQETTFPRYKMFQAYIEIMERGLKDHETYCKGINVFQCPINYNMTCKSSIRTCYVDNNDKLHYYDCCEAQFENMLDFKNDYKEIVSIYPKLSTYVDSKCSYCELFPICNGCQSQRVNYPPEHCVEMLKLKEKLIEYGWVTGFGGV